MCSKIINQYENHNYKNNYTFSESELTSHTNIDKDEVLAVGIDVGTTTISAAIINITKQCQIEFYTLPNKFNAKSPDILFYEQDADLIYDSVKKLLDYILCDYPNLKTIGITGQMHGILYVNNSGKAVSMFSTWQDKRADSIIFNKKSYCDRIQDITGMHIASGYGMATHFYNVSRGMVPVGAYTFCNITDYIAMRLTKSSFPTIHNSIAASFGLFNIKKSCFFTKEISELGMDCIALPNVTDDYFVYGKYKDAIVAVPIGDNQASFLGAVDDIDNSILLNIGTGSQISTVCSLDVLNANGAEIRPLVKGKYLLCGSALCGGSAYALIEKFFRDFKIQLGGNNEPMYDMLNCFAQEAYNSGKDPLIVNTHFRGTRQDPTLTGSIQGITDKNFYPDRLVLGIVYGICLELYDFFADEIRHKKTIIVSGNAVQKNSIFRSVISDIFKMPLKMPKIKEEAATGAALFAAVSAGLINNINDFKNFIKY